MALAATRPAPTLLIVIGGNGAGKSTWCRENRGNLPTNFYNADWIAAGLGDWNSPSKQLAAGRIVIRAIAENLDRGADFGFERTCSGRSGPAIVRRAKARGYAVHAVFIGTCDAAINIRRIAGRVANRTGHDVPVEVIRRRWAASMENLIVTADAIDTITIIDNSGTRSLVVATDGDCVACPQPGSAPWVCELAGQINSSRSPSGTAAMRRATGNRGDLA